MKKQESVSSARVNEQLLTALRGMMDAYLDLCDEENPNYNSYLFRMNRWNAAKAAIAAAEAQQADQQQAEHNMTDIRCECCGYLTYQREHMGCIRAATKGVQQEPVAAQCRFEGEEYWKPCTVAHHLLVQAHPKEWPHYETRALYAQPQAVAAQPAPAENYSEVQADAPAPAIKYGWSHNGEEYHGVFSSVEEAVCDYLNTYGEDAAKTVHVGEVKPYKPENPIWLACQVLEMLGEQAHDEIGECAGDWPELPAEKREQLGKMIHDFVCKHDAPSFFSIRKSEMVEVAAYRDAAVQPVQGGEV